MTVKTTINITKPLFTKINEASMITGMTKNDIVMMLIKQISFTKGKFNPSKNLRFASQVKYQPREKEKNNWHKLHVRFSGGDYEYAMDLKKIFKLSISFILAKLLRKYLLEIIQSTGRKERWDSYRGCAYTLCFDLVDGVVCWKIYWGIPPTLAGT